eukprot:1136685-Pelagomonas_calceolata.AAC.2
MAAQQRIKKCVHEHGLRSRQHALLWLSKVYGIPAGMSVCQALSVGFIIFTRYEREPSEKVASVKSTATYWPVLRVCGQEPVETLRQVLKADLHLADRGFYRGFEVQTACCLSLEGSGCPQYPRDEQQSSDFFIIGAENH